MMNHSHQYLRYPYGQNYGTAGGGNRFNKKNATFCGGCNNRSMGRSDPAYVNHQDGFKESNDPSRSHRGGVCGCGMNRQAEQRRENVNIPDINEDCGCGCGEGQGNCSKLLKQIQTVDFALYEVILYLDAYPDQAEALDFYHKLIERRRMLMTAYESSCGPMTAHGNLSKTSWDWVKKPAPWEYSES